MPLTPDPEKPKKKVFKKYDNYEPSRLRKKRVKAEKKAKELAEKEARKFVGPPKSLKPPSTDPRMGRIRKRRLKALKKMSRKDYIKMEKACVDAYLTGEHWVTLVVSSLTKFPKDFPLKYFVREEGLNVVYKIGAKRLLKWMNDEGHSDITGSQIGKALAAFSRLTAEI